MDGAGEPTGRLVVLVAHRRATVTTDVGGLVVGVHQRGGALQPSVPHRSAVDEQGDRGRPAQAPLVGELGPDLVGPGGHRLGPPDDGPGDAEQVVAVGGQAVAEVQAPPPEGPALGDEHPRGRALRHLDVGGDRVGGVLGVDHRALAQAAHAAEQQLRAPGDQLGPSGQHGQEALHPTVVQGQGAVLDRLDEEEALEVAELVGVLGGQVPGLGPVGGGVVELPGVVVQRRHVGRHPGDAVPGDRRPALVVDPPVAHDLEVLRLVAARRVGVVEAVPHADPVEGHLLDAVDEGRGGDAGGVQDGGGDVGHVVELGAGLGPGREPGGPVGHHPVAGAPEVGGHLLGPLVRGAGGVGPAHRIVVVGRRRPELVDVGLQELGGLEVHALVEHQQLVERAVRGALGTGPVVPDQVEDQGVLQDLELLQGGDQPAGVMVGVGEEPGEDLHLAGQHRLEVVVDVVPGRDLLRPVGQLGIGGDDAPLLLAGERLGPQHVPTGVEPAPVALDPLRGDVVGGVGGPRREVGEEGLVRSQGLLLPDPGDGPVGQVLGEVVALLGGPGRLDR